MDDNPKPNTTLDLPDGRRFVGQPVGSHITTPADDLVHVITLLRVLGVRLDRKPITEAIECLELLSASLCLSLAMAQHPSQVARTTALIEGLRKLITRVKAAKLGE